MATIDFVVSGNRIATESFVIGKIYEIIFTDGSFLICACNHVGNNFVVFQRELPELLFTLNMETASSVRSIEETGGGGGTYNYSDLENKPQINSVELSGNKSSSDLGLQSVLDASQLDAVNSGITGAKVATFEGKQDAITSDSKLSADLVDDATTTNKFVTAADKTAWDAKQNALTASQLDAVNSGITAAKVTSFEAKQDAITSSNKLSADLVNDATTANKFVTAADKTAWNAKQNVIDSLHMLDADLVDDTTATHKFATAAQLSQITTNKNNISLLDDLEAKDRAALVELVDGGAKNLLDLSGITPTVPAGITCVKDGEEWVVNGTLSTLASVRFLGIPNSIGDVKIILSGCPEGGSTTTYSLDVLGITESKDYGGGSNVFSIVGDTFTLRYVFTAGTYSDIRIKPMLCTKAAWGISHAYQPHRPSYQELYEMVKALQVNQ